jgi:RHS repeat-associated protein
MNTHTRYYFGNHERLVTYTSGAVSKTEDITYVYAAGKMVAVNYATSSVNTLYYVHTDFQGTPVALTNQAKVVVARYQYDAWGRTRNPLTLVYESPVNTLPWFTRGYTGHEHLNQFGLINMNARLYDPALGRFLQADNLVTDPLTPLNYNRYSYCVNNPLRYTDPSGYNFYSSMFNFQIKLIRACW